LTFRGSFSQVVAAARDGSPHARRKIRSALALGCALAAALYFRPGWDPDGSAIRIIRYAGILLIGFCFIARCWTTLYIGGRKCERLITRGPYSLTRNPLYLASMVGVCGMGLQTGSLVIGAMFAAIAYLALLPLMREEASELRRRFGTAYEAYAAEVPGMWVAFGSWRDADELHVKPRFIYRTAYGGLFFFAAIPLGLLLDALGRADAGAWRLAVY
jgi:protein-S-isoprenylcysteine O-methyltransferase Ste14